MDFLKKGFFFVLFLISLKAAVAQNDVEAIRYSQTFTGSTARSLSMGGAFGALGADFSSLGINPAGIALYRKSEFMLTPALSNRIIDSEFLGRSSTDNKYNFNLSNIGLVYAYPKESAQQGWKGWAFGIGYNKTNTFHSRSMYENINPKNSLLDAYVEEANTVGISPEQLAEEFPFTAGLAYNAFLLDTAFNSTTYFSVIPNGGALQISSKESGGSSGEAVISGGGNYNDVVFWGVTFGFPFVRYNEDVIYEEIDINETIELDSNEVGKAYADAFNFKSFTQSQTLLTSGNGFNAKLGLIFRTNEWFRFGVAVHTPTFYRFHDEYVTSLDARFENGSFKSEESPRGSFSYNLTTPLKAIGSIAFVHEQSGLLSIDYEFSDYSTAKLGSSNTFRRENEIIRSTYTQAHTIRAGAEWKYNILSFRIGGGYSTGLLLKGLSNPDTDQHKASFSAGTGIREENYFVDLGYGYSEGNEFRRPYLLADQDVPGAFSKIKEHRFLLTLGFRF